MKTRKGLIMFIIIMALSIGAIIYGMGWSINSSNDKLNICAREYGYAERGNWEKAGTINLDYKYINFNQTHMACCKKVKLINENGQIQYLNCTGTFAISEESE